MVHRAPQRPSANDNCGKRALAITGARLCRTSFSSGLWRPRGAPNRPHQPSGETGFAKLSSSNCTRPRLSLPSDRVFNNILCSMKTSQAPDPLGDGGCHRAPVEVGRTKHTATESRCRCGHGAILPSSWHCDRSIFISPMHFNSRGSKGVTRRCLEAELAEILGVL